VTMPPANDAAHNISLHDVLRRINDLPALPAIVMDIVRGIDCDDLDFGILARKMANDQMVAAKILRLANSSFYGDGKVATIQQAVTLLGVKTVSQMITVAALAASFPPTRCAGFDFDAFCRHSMATAVCARVLARHLHLNQDCAFTAGLLHDIGRLVLATSFTTHYEHVLAHRAAHDCYLFDAERAVLGIDHAQVGNALAAHWHFAAVLQHAISCHHTPDTLGGGSIASLINVADAIVHALDLAGVEDDLVPPISLMAWHGVGLNADDYLQVFRETELEFKKISVAL
jgi:putative nucleotidyltransferase with HDIG domain